MYIQYNPNPCGRTVGDCSVRAVSAALNISWEEAGYSNGYSYGHMSMPPMRVSYYDPSISMTGYSQGRGPYAKRDSLGRYASASGNFSADLQNLINEAPNEAIRQKLMVMMNDM